MTEKLRQSLSAAIDDEADAFELRRVLDELGRDAELRSLWDRYHIIGSALRGDRPQVPPAMRERIWDALESAADGPVTASAVPLSETSEEVVEAPQVQARPQSHVGRYTGLAVAASVAFAVVLGFNGIWGGDEVSPAGLAGNDGSAAAVVSTQPQSLPEVAGPGVDLGSEISPTDVQRAQAYMLHHTQQQALNQAGVMSFVKLATYEAP
jgi:sigma-E factor negative regulatory protein RseA